MPQQLACPKCQMVVSAPEALTVAPALCPGCQAEMAPVEEDTNEPIVGEVDEPGALQMRAVEVGTDVAPPRPTVMVPHSEPPKWKATAVAEAWRTVARGLELQRWAMVIALLLPIGVLVLNVLQWLDVAPITGVAGAPTAATWAFLGLVFGVVSLTGGLLVFGRLFCYRVPPNAGARLWMGVASIGTAVATLVGLASVTFLLPTDVGFLKVLHGVELVTLGIWLAAEWAFLWGLGRIGNFVKRPQLALFSLVTAVAALLVPALGLALVLGGARRLFLVLEIALAALCVMYLLLLRAAGNAVQTKAPKVIRPESETS
jgi:hypothetical protein